MDRNQSCLSVFHQSKPSVPRIHDGGTVNQGTGILLTTLGTDSKIINIRINYMIQVLNSGRERIGGPA